MVFLLFFRSSSFFCSPFPPQDANAESCLEERWTFLFPCRCDSRLSRPTAKI